MDLLTSIPAFLFALGAIVFVHELGHHVVAKSFGVRVQVFSLGFGKRLWGFERKGTDYRLSLVPLGGYVRMGGELPEERTGDPSDFLSKPRWQRVLVYLAGPAMNVVFSVVLIAAVFMVGIEMQAIQETSSVVGTVEEGSAGAEAGLERGDRIVELNGKRVEKWNDVGFIFATSPERPVEVVLLRDGQTLTVSLTPVKVPRYEYGDAGIYPMRQLRFSKVLPDTPAERAGFHAGDEVRQVDGRNMSDVEAFIVYVQERASTEMVIQVLRKGELVDLTVVPADVEGKGQIGVEIGSYRPLPPGEALVESVRFNYDILDKSIQILGKLFTNEIAPKSALSGPIEIAAWSGRAARRGFKELIYMMGFLSISIGFMNLLPIPILDGGHISILLVESVIRRDLSMILKERITQLGFMMLMTLMAVVIFFDLSKNLPGLFSGS
ncbi:MAG: RIP metalloprotease RseP [bacterium]|nr:RIP metalloprotease RseP [bacterium]